jgi:hypothetical protein
MQENFPCPLVDVPPVPERVLQPCTACIESIPDWTDGKPTAFISRLRRDDTGSQNDGTVTVTHQYCHFLLVEGEAKTSDYQIEVRVQ